MIVFDKANYGLLTGMQDALLVCYDGKSSGDDISLTALVNQKLIYYRTKYLEYIHHVNKAILTGPIAEKIMLKNGYCLWWSSLIMEKNVYKSPCIFDCIKILALYDLIKEKGNGYVTIILGDSKLTRCVKNMLTNMQVRVRVVKPINKQKIKLKKYIPSILKASGFLLNYFIKRRHLFNTCINTPIKKGIGIVSYFPFFNKVLAEQGVYNSNYLPGLDKIITGMEIHLSWLFRFHPTKECATSKKMIEYIRQFNKTDSKQSFYAIEQFSKLTTCMKVWMQYLKIYFLSFTFKKNIESIFDEQNIDLWPLMKNDVMRSLSGIVAIESILNITLFEAVTKNMSELSTLIYLMENQEWERSLIYVMRNKSRKIKVIGYPHSTVRPMDFRYYDCPSLIRSDGYGTKYPQSPDFIAVGGQQNKEQLLTGGVPDEKVINVEALRYLYLTDLIKQDAREQDAKEIILILFEMQTEAVLQMMTLFEGVSSSFFQGKRFIFKHHPFFSGAKILANKYKNIPYETTEKNLQEILPSVDVVICGNATSAVLDAVYAGKRAIVYLPEGSINQCPLLGCKDVDFISSSNELENVLENSEKRNYVPSYFELNPELTAWKRLINEYVAC